MLKTTTSIINASQIATPITFAGNVTLSTGNLVIGTSGKGIDFSATPGTGTSELFADYEEGTWTPNQGSGLTVVGTFSSSGFYTKVGRLVTVNFVVSGSTTIACSAFGQITDNLPFTCGNQDSAMTTLIGTASGVTIAGASTTLVYAFTAFGATDRFLISGTYRV